MFNKDHPKSLQPCLDDFQEDLEISGDLTSLDEYYDIVLAYMAEKIQ